MNDTTKELDYPKIVKDFEELTDYRTFILQYNHVQDYEVQFLIVKATWLIILNEEDGEHKRRDLRGFIRKYTHHQDDRIKSFVAHAMFFQLDADKYNSDNDEYLEACNTFIEFTSTIDTQTRYIHKGLILAYWCKAQATRKKDWRKSQYFYNKVVEFCQKLGESPYVLYLVKAQIAKVLLHLHFGHSEHIEKLFYVAMQKYANHPHPEIVLLLDHVINTYIHYLVSEDGWFYQAESGQIFIEFLSNNLDMQKIMLKSIVKENSVPRLVWVSYAYWGNSYHVLCEQYLLRYFKFFESWEEVLLSFKEYLQFNTAKDRKLFLEYAEDLHKRHISLEKYRKMFKSDKSKK